MNTATASDRTDRPSLHQVGVYSLAEAARYLHESRQLVGLWATGRQSRAKTGSNSQRTQSVFVKPPLRVDGDTVLTFAHLIELRLVGLFRKHGVSMPVIKAVAQSAARLLNTDHPFSSLDLKTDGRSIFAEITPHIVEDQDAIKEEDSNLDDARIVQDLHEMQVVMGPIVRKYFRDMDYTDRMASRWWLLGSERARAVIDPSRNFGQPIDNPTGVPLSVLYNLVIKGGETPEDTANWYGVPIDAVDTALEFHNWLNLKNSVIKKESID